MASASEPAARGGRALDRRTRTFLARHRVARLATADADGAPHVVPVCYAVSGTRVYFVVDDKPKSPGGRALKRMRNIAANPQVALVVDDWSEDWRRLAFVLIRGVAAIVTDARERRRALRALRTRYPQYRSMRLEGPEHPVVGITPSHAHSWRAAPALTRPGVDGRLRPPAGSRDRPTSTRPRSRARPRGRRVRSPRGS